MMSKRKNTWIIDQLAKSEFFHQKLHEWRLLKTAETLEGIRGDELDWNLDQLNISQSAWNKVIHQGIKPIRIFAHPTVLTTVLRSTSYYRMLAMVSQKSMKRVRLDVDRFEQSDTFPSEDKAKEISYHLNNIISNLIEADEDINEREFDLWRGMAAGTQAQGSWQNAKGDKAEIIIKGMLRHRLEEKELLTSDQDVPENKVVILNLQDGRQIRFGDEPDISIFRNGEILIAIEVKGGIDTAGVLERIGASIKSLGRAKRQNGTTETILLLQTISITQKAKHDLEANKHSINHWFSIEEVLDDPQIREKFFSLLQV